MGMKYCIQFEAKPKNGNGSVVSALELSVPQWPVCGSLCFGCHPQRRLVPTLAITALGVPSFLHRKSVWQKHTYHLASSTMAFQSSQLSRSSVG